MEEQYEGEYKRFKKALEQKQKLIDDFNTEIKQTKNDADLKVQELEKEMARLKEEKESIKNEITQSSKEIETLKSNLAGKDKKIDEMLKSLDISKDENAQFKKDKEIKKSSSKETINQPNLPPSFKKLENGTRYSTKEFGDIMLFSEGEDNMIYMKVNGKNEGAVNSYFKRSIKESLISGDYAYFILDKNLMNIHKSH